MDVDGVGISWDFDAVGFWMSVVGVVFGIFKEDVGNWSLEVWPGSSTIFSLDYRKRNIYLII